MLTFEERLQMQLDTDVLFRKSATGKRVARILALPASNKRRGRVLGRMEDHATTHLGRHVGDWGTVKAADWQSVLELLAKILPILLALFGL